MSSVQINASTTNALTGQPSTLFYPYNGNLRLNIDYTLSADLVNMPGVVLRIIFELIDFHTNQVFYFNPGDHPHPVGTASQEYYYRINPSDTAGMNWTANDIFGFRAAVTVSNANGPIDVMAVSDIQWFRLQDVFEL